MADAPPTTDTRRVRYDKRMAQADELLRQGSFDQAVQHFAAAAELARDGGAAPELATALHRAAIGRDRQGRLDEADWFVRQALGIDEQFFGPVHPAVARDLHSLGVVVARGGDSTEAVELLTRSASISRRFQSGRELLTTLMALGQAQHRTGAPEAAQVSFSEAAELGERATGPQSMHTVRALLALAAAQAAGRAYGQAHATWSEVTRRLAGEGTPPTGIAGALATAWMGLGDLALRARGDRADAAWMYSFANTMAPAAHPVKEASRTILNELGAFNEAPPAGVWVVVAAPAEAERVDVAHPTGGRLTAPRGDIAREVGTLVVVNRSPQGVVLSRTDD